MLRSRFLKRTVRSINSIMKTNYDFISSIKNILSIIYYRQNIYINRM